MTELDETNRKNHWFKLELQGVKYLARDFAQIIIHLVVLLAAAGKTWWINAWVLAGMGLVYQVSAAVVLMKYNPDLLSKRGSLIQEDTKAFDKVFVVLYLVLSLLVSITCGLDAVRFGWSQAPGWAVALGAVLYVGSCILGAWAMAVNQRFDMTVVIGAPEVHPVCSRGPYRLIRHPGYAAAIMGAASYTLILRSWWGLAASSILALLFIVRTALEDQALQAELQGYQEYSNSTRYRLLPYLW